MRNIRQDRELRKLGIDPDGPRLQVQAGHAHHASPDHSPGSKPAMSLHSIEDDHVLTHRSEIWDGKSETSEIYEVVGRADDKSSAAKADLSHAIGQRGPNGDALHMIEEEPLVATSSFDGVNDPFGDEGDMTPPFGMNQGTAGLPKSSSPTRSSPASIPARSNVSNVNEDSRRWPSGMEQLDSPKSVTASVDTQADKVGLLPLAQLTDQELQQERWLLDNWGSGQWRSALISALYEDEMSRLGRV